MVPATSSYEKIMQYIFDPKDYNYEYIKNSEIKGGDASYNAKKFIEMLDGEFKEFQHISLPWLCLLGTLEEKDCV